LYFFGNYEISGLQMKFAPPPIRPPQPPPNDLHFFWLNRVDLRYYWSFNSLLSKNNIEYPQTGHPFHTINADAFSKLKLYKWKKCKILIIFFYYVLSGMRQKIIFIVCWRISVNKEDKENESFWQLVNDFSSENKS
jgi:hypothetical protein